MNPNDPDWSSPLDWYKADVDENEPVDLYKPLVSFTADGGVSMWLEELALDAVGKDMASAQQAMILEVLEYAAKWEDVRDAPNHAPHEDWVRMVLANPSPEQIFRLLFGIHAQGRTMIEIALTAEIETRGAWVRRREIAHVLDEVGGKLLEGATTSGNIRDINGHIIGSYTVKETAQDSGTDNR